MTISEWLDIFDETKDEFKWFIDKFFPGRFDELLYMHGQKDWKGMECKMTDIWYALPDCDFNIIANPPGWNEFITLLEVTPDS